MVGLRSLIRLQLFRHRWRKNNQNNRTIPDCIFDTTKVSVGENTYGVLNINIGTNPDRKIKIGSYCSIAPNVHFVINPHNYKFFSTWGWQIFEYNERNYDWEKKTSIVVEDDVWIGYGAIILGGAVLRQGCVVGAGSVVSGEVPPYAIYARGEIIKYRFSPTVCEKLNRIDFNSIDKERIEIIKGWHKIEINEENIDKLLDVMPLKDNIPNS